MNKKATPKSVWSIETFPVDKCVEVTIILGYFQLVLFIDRIRISLLYRTTYKPPDTPMYGGSQDYFTMQLCSENFDVDSIW